LATHVSHLWRHPIKGCGVEAVETVVLTAGATMPWDRVWAVGHDAAKQDARGGVWASCLNFVRGARTPETMAIRAVVDEAAPSVTLSHPRRREIRVDPEDPADAARLLAWLAPLCDPDRAQPAFVARAAGRGMTDSDYPTISILNRASLTALGDRLGTPLAMERFRGNVWLDGMTPFGEFDFVGTTLQIGGARLAVRERIGRCKATSANPETGRIDADTLGALQAGWGHRDFGVYAEVVEGGRVAVGDGVTW
jgi:uncharacterized protein YcbX